MQTPYEPFAGACDYSPTCRPAAALRRQNELAAIREELAAWKHGVPASALPTHSPKMAARRTVDGWPEDDPLRRVVLDVYEAARTPLP